MTDFHTEVVRVGAVSKHPNADKLEIAHVNGMPVIFTSGSFKEDDLAAYIPVDALVPVERKEFNWLKASRADGMHRVKAKRLRGIFSMGFITDLPTNVGPLKEGDNVQTALGVKKWEPPADLSEREPVHNVSRKARKSETAGYDRNAILTALALSAIMALAFGPVLFTAVFFVTAMVVTRVAISRNRTANKKPNVPVYDIEGLRRNMNVFQEGEDVWITEKIHGCNSRFIHTGKKFHVGSRTQFRTDSGNAWAEAANRYGLEAKLAKHPGLVLFGEIYGGNLQDLNYGCSEVRFAAFDAMDVKTRRYMNVDEFRMFCAVNDIPIVPTIWHGPWSPDLMSLAEEPSHLGGGIREGFVVKPVVERMSTVGRCFLKHVGETYLLRKTGDV